MEIRDIRQCHELTQKLVAAVNDSGYGALAKRRGDKTPRKTDDPHIAREKMPTYCPLYRLLMRHPRRRFTPTDNP
jgi:hypothetical protein